MGGFGCGLAGGATRLSARTFETFLAGLPKEAETVEQAMMLVVAQALKVTAWNMSAAQRRLGVDRRTLYRMCERWGLNPAKERARAEVARG